MRPWWRGAGIRRRRSAEGKVEATVPLRAVAEGFLREHAEAKRKASTAREYRRLLEKKVLPCSGHPAN